MGLFNNYPDYAPRSWPEEHRMWWDRVYDTAMDVYTEIPGYHERDAHLTATVAAKTMRSGCRGLSYVPDPGDLAELGTFTAVDWADKLGTIWAETYAKGDRIPLMWSRKLNAIYAVPGLKPGACNMAPVFEDSKVLVRWTQGRRAGRCSYALPRLPKVALRYCHPGISVSYTSDKFSTNGKTTDYVHHFDAPGVRVYMDRLQKPSIIMIRGGQLRIETHGIAG